MSAQLIPLRVFTSVAGANEAMTSPRSSLVAQVNVMAYPPAGVLGPSLSPKLKPSAVPDEPLVVTPVLATFAELPGPAEQPITHELFTIVVSVSFIEVVVARLLSVASGMPVCLAPV